MPAHRLELDLLVGDLVLLLLARHVGDELLAGERLEAVGLLARGLDARLLQLHLAIDLGKLVLQVAPTTAQLLHLLRAELLPLRLLLLQDLAAPLHLLGHLAAHGPAGHGNPLEGDAGDLVACLHLVAFLDEELGDPPRIGGGDARGAGIERDEALDPFTPCVLSPNGDRYQEHCDAGRKQGEDPERDRAGDSGFAEKLLSLGVDRLLSE